MGDLAKGYAVGGNDFLNKPVDKEELFARVDTQIQLLKNNRQLIKNVDKLKQAQSQLVKSEKMASLATMVAGMARAVLVSGVVHTVNPD